MDSSLIPLLAATATAAGIFGWLTSRPRAPPISEFDGGGFVGDMYDAAARNVQKAKKATTDMVTNAFSHKDEYKLRAAEKYRQMQSGMKRGKEDLDAALERIKHRVPS